MNDYPAEVWRRFATPAHAGRLPAHSAVSTGRADTPAGDAELDVRVHDGRITAAAFRAYGCPCTVAAADWLCERVIGCRVAEAGTVTTARDIETALELAPEKRFCCLLAVDALSAALVADVEVNVRITDPGN